MSSKQSAFLILTLSIVALFSCQVPLASVNTIVTAPSLPNGRVLSVIENDAVTKLIPAAKALFQDAFGTVDPIAARENADPETYHAKLLSVYERQNELLRNTFGVAAEELIGTSCQSELAPLTSAARGWHDDPTANGYTCYYESSCWWNVFGRWNSAATQFRNSSGTEVVADWLYVELSDSLTGTATKYKDNLGKIYVDGSFYWGRAAWDPIPRSTAHQVRDEYTNSTTYTFTHNWSD